MQIYKHKVFNQWIKKEKINDQALLVAINEISRGLFDANLGGGLYKKRVAGHSQGKRGAYRTLLAFKRDGRAIFVFGFAKNERANIAPSEKAIFKKLAKDYLLSTNKEIFNLVKIGELIEIEV